MSNFPDQRDELKYAWNQLLLGVARKLGIYKFLDW